MKISALICAIALFGTLLTAAPSLASSDHYVYCARGKIIIDTRNLPQLTGSGVYKSNEIKELARFSDRGMAETMARHRGGVGAQCK